MTQLSPCFERLSAVDSKQTEQCLCNLGVIIASFIINRAWFNWIRWWWHISNLILIPFVWYKVYYCDGESWMNWTLSDVTCLCTFIYPSYEAHTDPTAWPCVLTRSIFQIIFCICSIHKGASYRLLSCWMMSVCWMCVNVHTQRGRGCYLRRWRRGSSRRRWSNYKLVGLGLTTPPPPRPIPSRTSPKGFLH